MTMAFYKGLRGAPNNHLPMGLHHPRYAMPLPHTHYTLLWPKTKSDLEWFALQIYFSLPFYQIYTMDLSVGRKKKTFESTGTILAPI